MSSILDRARSAVAWFKVSSHRKSVYKAAKYVIPLAVAGGYLTGGEGSTVLSALAVVLGFAAPHLADRNT